MKKKYSKLFRITIIVGLLIITGIGIALVIPEETSMIVTHDDIKLYKSLSQINAQYIIEEGLTGKGVKIGVIDAGFDGIRSWKILNHLDDNGQIKYEKNFVSDSITGLYDGGHGAWVLGYIAGKSGNYYEGLATEADFYLARNEYGKKDYRIEEQYLEQALEEMYQMGVRLVNISSGYTDKYEYKNERYSPEQMDGKTAYISKVCENYAGKGMIIIATAGNEGDFYDFWKSYICAPADAENIITVGATYYSLIKTSKNGEYITKAGFSGTGPEFLSYVKPDVVCFSEGGNSFSTPIITGLVATMLEYDSTLTLKQIKHILHSSSTLYPFPNNYIGYGVPDAKKVLKLLKDPQTDVHNSKQIKVSGSSYELETDSENIVVFHKSDNYYVKKQKQRKSSNGKFTLRKKNNCNATTVVLDNKEVYEIIWN